MPPRDDQPADLSRPWGRVSTIRLETFSDGVFAIAVTLLALQLHPPDLAGATTAGAVLHALGRQLRPFGFYILAFLVTGRLWSEHHQLLDPVDTHGRRLPRVNLWFLLTVSLLPYWVNVMATYPNNSGAAGLFILWLGVAQFAFALLCLLVRQELAAEPAVDELVMPRIIRATIAGALLAALGALLIAQAEVPDAVIIAWLAVLVIGGRPAVRVWSARHRRRSAA
jgi:TMEM175 potassium channel family protein